MRLWMAPILMLLVLVAARWLKVREDRRRAWLAEHQRWDAEREARGVMGEVTDDYFTFRAAQRWMDAEPPFENLGALPPGTSITCPDCGMTSYNPNDVAHGYCGHCHAFTRGTVNRA